MSAPHLPPSNVTIAGGGIAGMEMLLALRALAGRRVRTTLLSPGRRVTLHPFATATPFTGRRVPALALGQVAELLHANHVDAAIARVDTDRRLVVTASGAELPYGTLVLAVGARPRIVYEHALTFGVQRGAFRGLLDDIERGRAGRVAFVVPPSVSWSLPLYELALMTARHAQDHHRSTVLDLVTPEATPLAAFGPAAAEPLGRLLAAAGIDVHLASYATVLEDGVVELRPGGGTIQADRVVTLPALGGPAVAGLPQDAEAFVPIDEHCAVPGVDHVYAIGDATSFPLKQGGIATQMADAVAEQIAADAGAPVTPVPFRPVLRGKLLTGRGAEFLASPISGGDGEGSFSGLELWHPPAKVAGRYLGPWLADLETREPYVPHGDTVDIDRPLALAPYDPVPSFR